MLNSTKIASMSLGFNIALIVVFLLFGSIFAATELALVNLRSSQLDRMETQDARGKRVAKIARDPNTFLSTLQIGVTLSGFLSASFGESAIAPHIVPIVKSWGSSRSCCWTINDYCFNAYNIVFFNSNF